MKIQVRQGVFETNSSSMHSLVIKKESEYFTREEINKGIYLSKDGVWDIWEDSIEFGRTPFKVLNSFKHKWYYALAALCKEYKDEVWDELERIAFANIDGLTKVKLPLTENFVPTKAHEFADEERKRTEEEFIEYLATLEKRYEYEYEIEYWLDEGGAYFNYEVPYTGYAQDYGNLKIYLEENNISIEEFIMNKRYMVFVDGDEYCVTDSIFGTGLIDADKIDKLCYLC